MGIPVDLNQDQLKVIDNHFVVRFHDHVEKKDVDDLVKAAEGQILPIPIRPTSRCSRLNAASAVREVEIEVEFPTFTFPDVETLVSAQEVIYMRRIVAIMRRFFDECPTPPRSPFDSVLTTMRLLQTELDKLKGLETLRAKYMRNIPADQELLKAVAAICRRNAKPISITHQGQHGNPIAWFICP